MFDPSFHAVGFAFCVFLALIGFACREFAMEYGGFRFRRYIRALRVLTLGFFLPSALAFLFALPTIMPTLSSVVVQRTSVGPVALTASRSFSTQTDRYYAHLNGSGCNYHDTSVLKMAPVGSYVVLDKRKESRWILYPFASETKTFECTTSFRG